MEGYLSDTEDNEVDRAASSSAQPTSRIHSLLERHASHHLPPEKVPRVTSYVASLEIPQVSQPGEEEGEDQGIQMACTSESASNFSSPLLTPPDNDFITMVAMKQGEDNVITDQVDISQDRLNVQSSWPPQSSDTVMAGDRQPIAPSENVHVKAGRTNSLPTSLSVVTSTMVSSKFSFPPVDGPRTVKSCSPHCLQVPGDQVNILIEDSLSDTVKDGSVKTKSVLERIKEIEELNTLSNRPSLPRPDSAESNHKPDSKRGSTESLSSDESIPSQHSSQMSPPPSHPEVIPANNSAEKRSSLGSNSVGLEPPSPQCINTPESSPEPTRPKSEITSTPMRRKSLEPSRPLSECLGSSVLASSSEDLMSPSSRYKHAVDKHTLLWAQKTKVECSSHPDISTCEEGLVNKGVKELLDKFGGSSNSGNLKRSRSLRELERLAKPSMAGHKRASSGLQSPVSKSLA